MFALAGDIDMRTSLNFKRAVQEYGVPDVFLLNSGGGLVYIGLDLAMEVNRLGVTTVIPEEKLLLSLFFCISRGKRTYFG